MNVLDTRGWATNYTNTGMANTVKVSDIPYLVNEYWVWVS